MSCRMKPLDGDIRIEQIYILIGYYNILKIEGKFKVKKEVKVKRINCKYRIDEAILIK